MNEAALIPVYNVSNEHIGEMTVADALYHANEGEMELTSKGRGKRFRYTAARWKPRTNKTWKPRDSSGFTVLQLVEN